LRAVDVLLDDIRYIVLELTFGKVSAKKELTDVTTDRQQKDSQKNSSSTYKTEDKKQFKLAHKNRWL
jgi:hypothetical protein